MKTTLLKNIRRSAALASMLLLIGLMAPLAVNGQTTQLVQVTSLEVGETYVITCGNYAVGDTVYYTNNNHMIRSVSFSASDTPSTSIQYTIESGNATNGYIFKNVKNGKYIGYTSDEYLSLVESNGTPHKYDGTDLSNSVDSEGYYYVSLASSQYNYEYFTTSKGSQTSNPIVIYKVVTGDDTYVWVETTTITAGEEYLIGFTNGSDVYLAVSEYNGSYYESISNSYYGYVAKASFDGNGYVTGVSGYATDLQYCIWKFSTNSGGTIQATYNNYYLNTWSSISYDDLYPANNSDNGTGWTYASGNLYRTVSSTSRYAIYTTQNNNPYMCVTSTNPSSANVKLYTKQLVETGYAVNASSSISNGSIQFSINGGYDWYDNLSNVPAGETVIILVEPAAGYQLSGTPTVAPTSGTAPTVSGSGNQYSFEMPESDVTVNASFNCASIAAPTFSVPTGTYTTVQNVSISCATAGATIYYTTDGSTPTSSSTQYNGAITINTTTTLKAIAYIGSCTSSVATATYTINLPTYTVTCASGLTGGSISASPTSAVEGATITITATPGSGYFLSSITATDASNNNVAVTVSGNTGTFTMPASNVTVSATFTQGFHVTLNQTPNGTISADQTTGLLPGDVVTLTATPNTDCVFLAWYVYKTGDPRDVIAVVSNSWFYMPSSDVTVQAVFVTEEQHEQTVGGGTNTSNFLPTNVDYKYSLTQQIYTAAEIQYEGRITAIAFKALAEISDPRTLDIYMAHTSKTAFSSTTDWQTMGPSFLVFSGSVDFANNDWTTITLDTPFEYDGTSNLNICVVDITGDYESSSRAFGTYATSANRALYVNSDGTDYSENVNVSSISTYTGTQSTVNNQIKFTIKVPNSAVSLTVSPGTIDDFSYVEGQGPSQTHKLDIVGVDLENNITITAPTNFEICSTEDGTYTSSLTIPRETGSKGNRTTTTWDFYSGLGDWTVYDVDVDGYNWYQTTDFVGYNESTGCVVSASYDNDKGALTPNNWLVSPQVELGGTFSLYAVAQDQAWPDEHFGIYVSTTGTNTSDFTLLGEWTLTAGNWRQYSVDLSAYAGQNGYIAVRHFDCTNNFYIKVDHFVLDTDAHIEIEMPVTITPATVFVRMKGNLSRGTYSGTLTASAGSGTNVNGSVSLSGEVLAPSYYISLAPNPFDGGEVIGEGSYTDGTEITVTATKRGNYTFINWTENNIVVSTNASYTFTVTGNRNLVANFVPTHTLTWEQPTGGIITVSQNDNALTSPATVVQGSTLNITAAASTGYTFNGWTFTGTGASVADASNASTTLTMGSAATTLTASFTLNQHTVTYQYTGTVPSGAPAVPVQATYYYGTTVPAAAVPTLAGYTFSGWVGEVSTMPDQDVTVTGSWTAIDYTLTLVASPTEGGTVSASPAGTYHYGDVVTITATPASGYYFFDHWSDGTDTYTDNPLAITVTGPATYTAYFTAVPTEITNITDWSNFCKAVNSGHSYSGQTVNLRADLNLTSYTGAPAGTNTHSFQGTFEGNGHTIANYSCSSNDIADKGLFGYVNGGTIQNLTVNATLSGTSTAMGIVVGTFAGSGAITNVGVSGSITGSSATYMGGLVGNKTGGSITNSYSNVSFSGSATNKGGLVGANTGTLNNCYALSSGETSVSPIAGSGSGTVSSCYSLGSGTGSTYTAAAAYSYGDYTSNNTIDEVPMVDVLNSHVDDENEYKWIRPKNSSINDGYPVLVKKASSGSSKDGEAMAFAATSGSKAVYYGTAAEMLSMFRTDDNADVYVYSNGDLGSVTTPILANIFIDEDAAITQNSIASAITATVGITIDNTVGNGEENRDWHCFAAPIEGAEIGIQYKGSQSTEENLTYGTSGDYWLVADDDDNRDKVYFPKGISDGNQFDLYSFYEPDYHWINLKRATGNHHHQDGGASISYTNETTFTPGKGYLVALGNKTDENNNYMQAKGVLNNAPAAGSYIKIPVTNTTTEGHHLDGYNLLGNPFQSYLDFNRFANANKSVLWGITGTGVVDGIGHMAYLIYDATASSSRCFREYLIDGYEQGFSQGAAQGGAELQFIHMHQGFFVVKTTEDVGGDEVVFTNEMRNTDAPGVTFRDEQPAYPLVNLFCTDDEGAQEVSVIELNRPLMAGSYKMKEMLGSKANMYIRWDGEDYSNMFIDHTPEFVPVWFKSTEEGVFTMSWSTANDNFGYLHLVDNLTGNDIDMLATDSYAFQSRPSDSKARFRLVFKPLGIDEETTSEQGENFAFINGNELVVNGEGELSLIDLNGRVLATEYVSGQQSHITMPKVAVGMYMLRLTNNKDVKVQKIVVRK